MMLNDNELEAICQHLWPDRLKKQLVSGMQKLQPNQRLRDTIAGTNAIDWKWRDNCSFTQHDPSWRVQPIIIG